MKKRKRRKHKRNRKQKNMHSNSIPEEKSEANPESFIEKSQGLSATHLLKEKSKEFPRSIPSKFFVTALWLGKKFGWFISGMLTLLTFQQFLFIDPEIIPIDFGSAGPIPIRFTIHNPSSIVGMYGAQIAIAPGPGIVDGKSDELRKPFMRHSSDPCEKLKKFKDFDLARKDNLMIDVSKHDLINSNESVTFDTGYKSEKIRMVVGIAVRYNVKLFGTISLWPNFTCRMFQTLSDFEGHTHIIPYTPN